jgi:hypothetical protein
VDVFEMCLRTAFLAVNYTDRFLDIVMVKKTRFQLLGATCLHVASKCEDVSYIGVEDLAMCADNVYTSAEVLKMEEKLLNTLNFTLSVPTGRPSLLLISTHRAKLIKPHSLLCSMHDASPRLPEHLRAHDPADPEEDVDAGALLAGARAAGVPVPQVLPVDGGHVLPLDGHVHDGRFPHGASAIVEVLVCFPFVPRLTCALAA